MCDILILIVVYIVDTNYYYIDIFINFIIYTYILLILYNL